VAVVIAILAMLVLFGFGNWIVNTFIAPQKPAPVAWNISDITANGDMTATKPVKYTAVTNCSNCTYAWVGDDGNQSNEVSPSFTMGEGVKKVYVKVTAPDGTWKEFNKTFPIASKPATGNLPGGSNLGNPTPPGGSTGSTSTKLDVNTMKQWITQTQGDAEATNLVTLVGQYCDNNPTSCVKSEGSGWTAPKNSVNLTDPIGVDMTQYGWRLIKSYQSNPKFWGVYYCPLDYCVSPKPGRAAVLSAPLP
jgi:hypothetical protein